MDRFDNELTIINDTISLDGGDVIRYKKSNLDMLLEAITSITTKIHDLDNNGEVLRRLKIEFELDSDDPSEIIKYRLEDIIHQYINFEMKISDYTKFRSYFTKNYRALRSIHPEMFDPGEPIDGMYDTELIALALENCNLDLAIIKFKTTFNNDIEYLIIHAKDINDVLTKTKESRFYELIKVWNGPEIYEKDELIEVPKDHSSDGDNNLPDESK